MCQHLGLFSKPPHTFLSASFSPNLFVKSLSSNLIIHLSFLTYNSVSRQYTTKQDIFQRGQALFPLQETRLVRFLTNFFHKNFLVSTLVSNRRDAVGDLQRLRAPRVTHINSSSAFNLVSLTLKFSALLSYIAAFHLQNTWNKKKILLYFFFLFIKYYTTICRHQIPWSLEW